MVLPKTGHVVNQEEPALFNEAVADFIARVEAGRWPARDPRSIGSSGSLATGQASRIWPHLVSGGSLVSRVSVARPGIQLLLINKLGPGSAVLLHRVRDTRGEFRCDYTVMS